MARNNKTTEETTQTQSQNADVGAPAQSHSATGPYARLLELATRLPSAYAAGAPISQPVPVYPGGSVAALPNVVYRNTNNAGVMVYRWASTIGVSTAYESSANLAITEVASYIKSTLSKKVTWEAPDLGIYMLALGDMFSFLDNARRVYGLIRSYSAENKYMPKAILEAMGYDFDDFEENMANLRYFLNHRANELARFGLPSTFRLYARHSEMNSFVYTDSENTHAQFYVFQQAGFWSYEVVDQAKGLTFVPMVGTGAEGRITYRDFRNMWTRLMNAFKISGDVDEFNADILRAYGDAAIHILAETPDDYRTPFVYDPMMLCSINNMNIVPVDYDSLRVYDGQNGLLLCMPKFGDPTNATPSVNPVLGYDVTASCQLGDLPYLNFVNEAVTPEEAAAAVAFHTVITSDVPVVGQLFAPASRVAKLNHPSGTDASGLWCNSSYYVAYCGTEIIMSAELAVITVQRDWVSDGWLGYGDSGFHDDSNNLTFYSVPTYGMLRERLQNPELESKMGNPVSIDAIAYLSQFKAHHPMVFVNSGKDTSVEPLTLATRAIAPANVRIPMGEDQLDQIFNALLYLNLFT